MNITASLPPPPPPPSPPPPVSIAVFPPSSLLLHYSSVRWESPAHGSSCCRSCRSIEPAGFSSSYSPATTPILSSVRHPSIHPGAWRLRAGPFLVLRGRVSHHQAALLAAGNRHTRGEKRGFFFFIILFGAERILFFCLYSFIGLQFWLCVGTRKRGPKCLKPITCCRFLGVTLRCVALIYVACQDNALI